MRSWLLCLLLMVCQVAAADFPSPTLLESLKSRLTKPEACHPHCVAIEKLQLRLEKSRWQMRFDIHAERATAVPLPAREGQWWPGEIRIDGRAEPPALFRDKQGALWVLAPAGINTMQLAGPAPRRAQVDLPLPLRPARVVDGLSGQHWAINGVDDNGVPRGGQLQLIRKQTASAGRQPKTLEPGVLPPLLKVSRTLHLGLEWTVRTHVQRLSPAGSPITIALPLIEGEAVTTEGFDVADGKVQVRLPPGQSSVAFASRLEPVDSLTLQAPVDERWFEEWRLDIGPIWHVEYQGLPVVHHQDGRGAWLPTFSPLPGEQVVISITRPAGVPGRVLTIDQSQLQVAPGQRATDSTLSLHLRASQGGQHPIKLPPGAVLRKVSIDGKTQPVRQEADTVSLPVRPGAQQFKVEWRQDNGIGWQFQTPAVDLGIASVNHAITVQLGQQRWTLFAFGPLLGPAVLFWSVLLVAAVLAIALGRVGIAPLKWYHWLLLGIGLTQSNIFGALVIAGWLLYLGAREKMAPIERPAFHNLLQIATVVLTLAAVSALFDAVSRGLLGFPAMQIEGNGSTAYRLNWYQDQADAVPDAATVVSVPLLYYRVAMLAWALWIAFALLRWLKWGWGVFSRDELWRRSDWTLSDVMKRRRKATPPDRTATGDGDPWLEKGPPPKPDPDTN